jgi:dihydrofolate reductase
MRKLVVSTFVSIDGVMQAPGGKGEDPSGGFDLEGWTVPYFDDDTGALMDKIKFMGAPFDLLLGKTTYEIFASYWPDHPEGDMGEAINKATKYVVSNEPINTEWKESVQIKGDIAAGIQKLKQEEGRNLQVMGSSNLIQTLLATDLIDELQIMIFPITLGKGKRLFGDGTLPKAYKLLETSSTPSGVIVAKYQPAGEVKTGSFS